MIRLSREIIHNVIDTLPSPIRGKVADVLLLSHEYYLSHNPLASSDSSAIWYRANRRVEAREDHAKMSLPERTWYLLDANPSQQEMWREIIIKVGNMGNFKATSDPGKINEILEGTHTSFVNYLASLETAPSDVNYHNGRELASTQTREELFRLCSEATSNFTKGIPKDNALYNRIETASYLNKLRSNQMAAFYNRK